MPDAPKPSAPVVTDTPAAPTLAGNPIPAQAAPTKPGVLAGIGGNKALLAMLATGGLGAGLGGLLSSRDPGDSEETPAQRRKRILMNVLGGGAAGAGIAGAGILGYDALNKAMNEGDGGVVSRTAKSLDNLTGRTLSAVGVGASAAKGVGRLQQNALRSQLFAKDLPAVYQSPKLDGGKGLGRGKFTKEMLDSAFNNPDAGFLAARGSKIPRDRAQATTDAIQETLRLKTPEQAKAVTRGLGYTPVGESPMTAAFKRNLLPHGTPSKSFFRAGKPGLNPRMLGGAAGSAAGWFAPDLVNWGLGTYDNVTNPTRNVGKPGT